MFAAAEYDRSLAWAALLLVVTGLLMVYSASTSTAEASRYTGQNPAYYLLRHAAFLAVSLAAAIGVFLLPVRFWQQAAPWLFLGCLALLVLRADPGHRARSERRAALDQPLRGQCAALGGG